jgi:alkanesulfonate monooxygenase SsuD/methylene tetrahydromethanopterin reductase-like flavin-dependent oxidoreductase (luciferase family)
MLQPVPMLARVAAESGSMTLGTAVLITTLLNPVETAENVATLTALTEGRFVLGAGVGYRPEEDAAFGVVRGRVGAFAGKMRVIRRLLDGEEVTAEGPGYKLAAARLSLAPQPRPEIWIAATTDAGIHRVAELGDAWLVAPSTPVSELRRQRALLADEIGTEPQQLPVMREAVVAPSNEEARKRAEPFLNPVGTSSTGGFDLEPGRYVVGDPETAAEELRAVLDAGADHVIFRVQRPGISLREAMETLELLGSEVLPGLRRAP